MFQMMGSESQSAEESIMSDPAVSAFLTQQLCAHGGRLLMSEIQQHLNLPLEHITSILREEASRFLLLKQDGVVLARSDVRLCKNYRRDQCQALDCECLHLCRYFVLDNCFHLGKGNTCKMSHDIDSVINKAVLKANKISNLNKVELQVLLLQNDPSFLPELCPHYNRKEGSCPNGVKCSKLHICGYFVRGQCRFSKCNKSHNLRDANATRLLLARGLKNDMIENILLICIQRCEEVQMKHQKNMIKGVQASVGQTPLPTTSTYTRRPAPTPLKGIKLTNKPSYKSDAEASTPTPKTQDPAPGRSTSGSRSSLKMPAADDSRQEVSPKASSQIGCSEPKEICLHHIWTFCKNFNKCVQVHYYLPYRWQMLEGAGEWKDLSSMEDIEKDYCDPNNTRSNNHNIDFEKMTSSLNQVQRLSTASSVTKSPQYILTTEWVWYWKNEHGQWIEYGKHGGKESAACDSTNLESAYLADKKAVVPFVAGSQKYEMHFEDMIQRNLKYGTEKKVLRRPRFVSQEDVRKLKANGKANKVTSAVQGIPAYWDRTALPNVGYKLVDVHKGSSEFIKIQRKFEKTMSGHSIQKIRRIQNPSLWEVYQMQMKKMKRLNKEKDVCEMKLFHSADSCHVEAICRDNFDWRDYGVSTTSYGKGSYFYTDAARCHCQTSFSSKAMFLARVLVGDFAQGNASYTRPPPTPTNPRNLYDSCVDNEYAPSVFIIFEKLQIYPGYVLEYAVNRTQDKRWEKMQQTVPDKEQEKAQDKAQDKSTCSIS